MDTLMRIIDLLNAKNKSQKDLTDYLGISKNAFTNWKNGSNTSYKKKLPEIADFLNVSIDYLLGKCGENDNNQLDYNYNIEASPHVIAYVDILGIKNMLSTQENKVNFLLNDIYSIIEHSIHKMNKDNTIPTNNIQYKIFSDNVIFAIQSTEDNKVSNAEVLVATVALFQFGILQKCNLLCRGCICEGTLCINNLFVIGKGLSKAYELESHNSFYPRIIIESHLADMILNKIDVSSREDTLIKYDFDSYPFLNYLHYAKDELDSIKNHFDNLSKQESENSTNSTIMQKINWAKCYHNLFCKEYCYTDYMFKQISINTIYDYHNIFGTCQIANEKDIEIKLNKYEMNHLMKYKKLDSHGREVVDIITDKELERSSTSGIHSVEEEYAPSFIAAQGGEKTDSKPLTESELIDIDKLADDEQ